MNFERFAEMHGLIINHLAMDRWIRVPTTDHPHKKNGSYKFVGNAGWVQNFATMEEPVMWKDKNSKVDLSVIRQNKKKSEDDRLARQQKASAKAGFIMKSAVKGTHPYLAKKGFAEEKGYIWNDLLVIPMRINGSLVGCQLIDKDGTKKFLSGQITKGASAVFENKGLDIICEGYATALSVRRVMKLLRKRYTIHVAFSAGNVYTLAKNLKKFIVIADNDPVGIKTAKQTGKPYWVSDVEGEDFNDAEQRLGTEILSLQLSRLV